METTLISRVPVLPPDDLTTEELEVWRARLEETIADSVGAVDRRREFVAFTAPPGEVTYICRIAARYALGMYRDPEKRAG